MRFRPSLMVLVVMTATSGLRPATAQTDTASRPEKLSLDQAERLALENHPALREAEAAVEAAEAQIKQARANYYPQLSFSGIGKIGLSGATGALGLAGFPGSPFFRNLAYSANWYQTIFDFGRTRHHAASRESLANLTRFKRQAEQDRIKHAVRRAYFSVLEARRLQRLADKTVDERRLTLARVQAYFQARLRSQLDVRLAEANLAEAQGDLIRVRSAVRTSEAALQAAMGVEGESRYELEEPAAEITPPPSLQELLASARTNRPDLNAAEAKVAAFSAQVGATEAERRPEIRGFAAGGQGRFQGTSVKENQRHGLGALGIIFPFFTGGRLKGQEEEARAELKGAMAAHDVLRQHVRLEVTAAHSQVLTSQEAIRAAGEQERAAGDALRLAQARFQARLASFLELTTAEVTLTRAETNHARALYDYRKAWADLDFSIGPANIP